jgi:Predicted integral membrane protein
MATIERAAIKTAAKSQLKGNLGILLLTLILYVVIVGISAVTYVGPIILTGPFLLGLAGTFLLTARGQKPGVNNLFDGFKQFLGAFVAYLLVGIFTFLWTLLLIVPGIIAALRYSQTFFVLKDNPEIDGLAAIKKSKELMKGHKGEFFVLQLSFIPWFLLGCITLGLGFIYVAPYYSLTIANYYENLKNQPAS